MLLFLNFKEFLKKAKDPKNNQEVNYDLPENNYRKDLDRAKKDLENKQKEKEKLNKDLVIKSLNKDLGTLIKSYKIQNDKIIKKQQEIICCASNIDTQLKTLNLKKEELHDKLKSCIKKIEKECGNRNLDDDVLKEEEEK